MPMTNIKEEKEDATDLEISREVPDAEINEEPSKDIKQEVELRSHSVMKQLSSSLRSKSLSVPPNVVTEDSTKKPRAGSDIFTRRFKSTEEGIENPTSL